MEDDRIARSGLEAIGSLGSLWVFMLTPTMPRTSSLFETYSKGEKKIPPRPTAPLTALCVLTTRPTGTGVGQPAARTSPNCRTFLAILQMILEQRRF